MKPKGKGYYICKRSGKTHSSFHAEEQERNNVCEGEVRWQAGGKAGSLGKCLSMYPPQTGPTHCLFTLLHCTHHLHQL